MVSAFVKQYIIVITVNLNMITAGMMMGWGSPMLVKLLDGEATPLEKPLTQNEGSWVISATFIGGFFLIFMPAITNILGRKKSIIAGAIPNFISCLLCIFGNSFWMILAGRAIASIGSNFLFNTIPIYAAEIAHKEIRGRLGTIMFTFLSIGYLIMVAAGPHMSYVACNVMFATIVLITALPSLLLPESPYCLFIRGKRDATLKVLQSIRASEALASEEMISFSSHDEVVSDKPKIVTKTFIKSVILLVILAMFGQMTGNNAIASYLQTIFISTNTTVRPELATAVIGTISLIASLLVQFVTDRFGRKPILSSTALGMSVALFGLGTFFYMKDNDYQIGGVMNFVPLASLVLFVLCYSAGFASIFFPYIPELFDGPGRPTGLSIINFGFTLFGFTTVTIFPKMLENFGPAFTFWTFGAFCVGQCLFVIFFLPETKGKTFLEIQKSLGAKRYT